MALAAATSRGYGTGSNMVPNGAYGSFSNNTRPQANRFLRGTQLQSPYDLNQFKGYGKDLYGKLMANGIPGFGKGAGGYGSYGASYGAPDDPILKGHLANLIGGTRQIATKAGQDAAYAGPNRAGTGVVGGGDQRSVNAYNTAKAISGDYGQNYRTAADLSSKYWGDMGQNWQSGASLLSSILGLDLGAQQGQARFLTDQANTGVALNAQDLQAAQGAEQFAQQKYFDELNYGRGAADRAFTERQRANEERGWLDTRAAGRNRENQIAMLESLQKQKNSTSWGAGWDDVTGRMHISDLLASLQKTGPYGGARGTSKQAQFSGQPGY